MCAYNGNDQGGSNLWEEEGMLSLKCISSQFILYDWDLTVISSNWCPSLQLSIHFLLRANCLQPVGGVMLKGLSELQAEKGMQASAFPLKPSPVSTGLHWQQLNFMSKSHVWRGCWLDGWSNQGFRSWFCPGADQRASYISSGDLSFLFC